MEDTESKHDSDDNNRFKAPAGEDAQPVPPAKAKRGRGLLPGEGIGNNNARLHGLVQLKRAIKELGNRAIDKRSRLGKALAAWENEIIADCGGAENISSQQRILIQLVIKQLLMLESIDPYILNHRLIDHRKRALRPIVLQRQQLADGLAKYLNMLGLEKRSRIKTLEELLSDEIDDLPRHDRD